MVGGMEKAMAETASRVPPYVLRDTRAVLEAILRKLEELRPLSRPSATLSHKGEREGRQLCRSIIINM